MVNRKLNPTKYAVPNHITFAKIVVVNALFRDGASLKEISQLLNLSKTSTRCRYYGIANDNKKLEDPGYFRMNIGACCDINYKVDYENLETYKSDNFELYRNVVSDFKTTRKRQIRDKKRVTLRELLLKKNNK